MINQEKLQDELLKAVSYATVYAITDGNNILTAPISKESNILLHELLASKVPLLVDPESSEPMTEFSLKLNADPRDREMGVNIALVNNVLFLTSWGGIRDCDGQPERYPPEQIA